MGEILFARVDDRLIHGQVILKWIKSVQADTILVIDNILATDKYMRDVYRMAAPPGVSVDVVDVKTPCEEWQKGKFKRNRILLLFKDISTVKDSVEAGLPIKVLNIGGIGKKLDQISKQIGGVISLGESDAKKLLYLKEEWNIEIFFQVIPDQERLDLLDVLRKYFKELII